MKILRKGPDDCGINSFLIAAMPLFSKSNESWTPSTILYWSLLGVLAFELSMCLLGKEYLFLYFIAIFEIQSNDICDPQILKKTFMEGNKGTPAN